MDESSEKTSELLVVDDSPAQAEPIKYILEKHGYGVPVAITGREAMEYLTPTIPSAIISDVIMPEINGLELCQSIKTNEVLKNIPIIPLTTLSEPEDVIRGLSQGWTTS